MTKRYGNDLVWCFLEDGWETNRPIEVWHSIGKGLEEVMAHATDKYNAMQIVDALILSNNVNEDPVNKLSKKEIELLSFIESRCQEPYSTMAGNAIMWNDREVYTTLKAKFNEIY